MVGRESQLTFAFWLRPKKSFAMMYFRFYARDYITFIKIKALPSLMRLFIAIDLPLQVKDVVSRFEKELSMFKLRFVKPEHMHITLTFLGDIEDVDAIKQRLGKIRFSPFKLKIYAYGFFPSTKKIRVIWIGLEHNEEFINLQHDIRELFDNKEKFMPHITIARAREIIIREAEQLNYAI